MSERGDVGVRAGVGLPARPTAQGGGATTGQPVVAADRQPARFSGRKVARPGSYEAARTAKSASSTNGRLPPLDGRVSVGVQRLLKARIPTKTFVKLVLKARMKANR